MATHPLCVNECLWRGYILLEVYGFYLIILFHCSLTLLQREGNSWKERILVILPSCCQWLLLWLDSSCTLLLVYSLHCFLDIFIIVESVVGIHLRVKETSSNFPLPMINKNNNFNFNFILLSSCWLFFLLIIINHDCISGIRVMLIIQEPYFNLARCFEATIIFMIIHARS